MHNHGDTPKKSRKRAVDQTGKPATPPSKRPAVEDSSATGPEQAERVRATVRALYTSYNALINRTDGNADSQAFQAVLNAAEGDISSQRLAARLLPRFIDLFPEQLEVAANALIKLYERYQDCETFDKPLEEHTRRDALQGLQAVLAASSGTPEGFRAVKPILDVLFRHLPQAETDGPTTDEMTEEEGEVAPQEQTAKSMHGPWVKKMLRRALQLHPVATLSFCFGCLGSTTRNSSCISAGPLVLQGIRLWLKDDVLQEVTPSREGTPMDCDGNSMQGGGFFGKTAAGAVAAAAAATGSGTDSNGVTTAQAKQSAAAPGTAGQQLRGCVLLQAVLESSADLRVWVRQELKGIGKGAPKEVKAILQTAVQLMPADRSPAAGQQPHNSSTQQQQRQGSSLPGTPASHNKHQHSQQQYPHPPTHLQPPYQQPGNPGKALNGVEPWPANGMEPLGRSWSSPALGRSQGKRAFGSRLSETASPGLGPFPSPSGPVCLLWPCVLLSNLPWHLTAQDLQQQLQAPEAWLLDQQQPPPEAAAGRDGAQGAHACCVLKAPLDAARVYMRHHKTTRLGQLTTQPTKVCFADSIPSCSKSAHANAQPVYVWALRSVSGDAETLTDELREAGIVPKSVSRVNHSSEPGTVLEAHSAKEAIEILNFLSKTHAASIAAAGAAVQQHTEQQPPLPSDPPPAVHRTPAAISANSSILQATPSPAAATKQPLQHPQHGQISLVGAPASQQQQQQSSAGFSAQGFGRTNSLPAGGLRSAGTPTPQQKTSGEGSWRGHHSSWGAPVPPQQHWEQQQPRRQMWQHSTPPHHPQQQQQGRWHAGAGPSPGGAQGLPPIPGAPAGHQQQQQQHQQLQRQQSFAGASPGQSGGTPTHGSPAGPPLQPPGQVPPPGPGSAGPGPAVTPAPQYVGSRVLWQGRLCKSEVPVGTVCCVEAAGAAKQSGAAPEPLHWPEALHINHRINVADVLELYAAAPHNARAVRLLLPREAPAGNVQAIQSFVQYLTGKGRAGMVRLPAGNGLSARALFIVVPRSHVCESLQVTWDGRGVMLIVVVVPSTGGAAGSSGGGSGFQHALLPPAASGVRPSSSYHAHRTGA